MVHKSIAAVITIVAALPVAAASAERTPPPMEGPDARYCMHVEAVTGSLVQTVRCWTREQWADQGVDLDEEWSKEGLGVKR